MTRKWDYGRKGLNTFVTAVHLMYCLLFFSFPLALLAFLKSSCRTHLQNDPHPEFLSLRLLCGTTQNVVMFTTCNLFVQSNKMNLQFSELLEDGESLFMYMADPVSL